MGKRIEADEIVTSKASTSGMKIDTESPDYGWRDLTSDVTVRTAGAPTTLPTFETWNGNILAYKFAVGDLCYHTFHMPHDWAFGTDLYIHAHWSHGSGATPTANDVTWEFECSWAKGFDQAVFTSPVTCSATLAANTTALTHMISEVQLTAASPSASQIDTDILEVDGLFIVRTRLAANASGEDPFLHTVDLHYQSHSLATKNKAPNFYS